MALHCGVAAGGHESRRRGGGRARLLRDVPERSGRPHIRGVASQVVRDGVHVEHGAGAGLLRGGARVGGEARFNTPRPRHLVIIALFMHHVMVI